MQQFPTPSQSTTRLEKAKFVFVREPVPDGAAPEDLPSELPFFLNPESVRIKRGVHVHRVAATHHGKRGVRVAAVRPLELTIDKMYFDTYETRTCVRQEYIDILEAAVHPQSVRRIPPAVIFCWGRFTGNQRFADDYVFVIEDLDVRFTMFLPDGTPVRAEVALKLCQWHTGQPHGDEPGDSADQAGHHTVRGGESLQALAYQHYGDPTQWRRIADANKMDDPMRPAPGSSLSLPPLHR